MRWAVLPLLFMLLVACDQKLVSSSGKFGEDNPKASKNSNIFGVKPKTGTSERKALKRGTDFFFNAEALKNSGPGTALVVPAGSKKVEMNLSNASISAAAEAVLGQTLNKAYIVGDGVAGRMTIQTTGPVPISALYDLFVAGLEANNVRIEKRGNVLRILPGKIGSRSYTSVANTSAGNGAIVVAPLKYISATQMVSLLQPSIEDGLSVRADKRRNLLLLSGNSTQLSTAVEAMNLFDVDILKGKSVALVRLDAADPTAVVEELQVIFESGPGGNLEDVVQFIPNPRLKSILVITSRSKYLADAQKWIRDLDRTAGGARRYSQIYELQNRSAAELAPILAELMQAEASAGTQNEQAEQSELAAFDGSTSKIQILADDAQNAIIARAFKKEHEELVQLVARLDTSLKQVLLEATIAEVTLNDDLNLGVGWFFQSGNFSSTFSPNSTGTVGNVFPGFSAVFGTQNASIALNALASVTDVKVISSPTLMVLDNKEAVLQIGDQVPIATRNAVDPTDPSQTIVNTIEYRDTGVMLKVKPRIGNGGRVVLDIEQEVSDVAQTTTSGIDSPTIRQRQVQTSVVIEDGSTLALGGFIQEQDTKTRSKVPGVGDIPVLGNLFKSKANKGLRTELLILIRPKVIHDSAEARAATDYWRNKLQGPNSILATGLGKKSHKLPTN